MYKFGCNISICSKDTLKKENNEELNTRSLWSWLPKDSKNLNLQVQDTPAGGLFF